MFRRVTRFNRLASALFTGCIAAFAPQAHAGPALPLVHVTTKITGPSTITSGQTTTINIRASVQSPANSSDGIFTFDVNAILANLISGGPQVLQVQSITRPLVDPNPLYGDNGVTHPNGIQSLHGTFLTTNMGFGGIARYPGHDCRKGNRYRHRHIHSRPR